jgi:hypothetical protein
MKTQLFEVATASAEDGKPNRNSVLDVSLVSRKEYRLPLAPYNSSSLCSA